jgi:hypothetical protein
MQQMQERDKERVMQCRREVDDSLRDLRTAHGEMKDVLMGMTEDGAVLANEIGSAVRGLQFQDRVSQRIAHVISDLEILQTRLAAGSRAGSEVQGDLDDGFSAYTMHEEREVAGIGGDDRALQDVELF